MKHSGNFDKNIINKKYTLIVVFDKKEKNVLVCKREKEPYKGKYNFIGGKIEKNETEIESAYRELFEETGITKNDIILHNVMNFDYLVDDLFLYTLCIYTGKLNKHIDVVEELNKLFWFNIKKENFFDINKFAGQGNMGHILDIIKSYKENNFLKFD